MTTTAQLLAVLPVMALACNGAPNDETPPSADSANSDAESSSSAAGSAGSSSSSTGADSADQTSSTTRGSTASTTGGTDDASNGGTGSVTESCDEPPIVPEEFAGSYPELKFCDEFTTFDIQHAEFAPQGRWSPTFHWGSSNPELGAPGDRTLWNNPQDEWFVSEFYSPDGIEPVNPFAIVEDQGRTVLRIRAEPAPAAMLPHMFGHQYTSGMISSRTSFAHQYGYSVVRVRLPGPVGSEAGTWVSAWWVASNGDWPPEFDLFDNALGATAWVTAAPGDIEISYDTLADNGRDPVDFSAGYHDFGFGWTPQTVSWWLDGEKIREAPTPDSFHQEMFFLLTFAVGAPGAWDGNADVEQSTVFPADAYVDGFWSFGPQD